jgi:hypothetical protein
MAIKDVTPDHRSIVSPIEGMRTIVDTRKSMAPDHLVDTIARGYALEIKTSMPITKPVDRSTTTHLTKVTYG